MKRVTITIETDNAAFEDNGVEYEVSEILRKLAVKIKCGFVEGAFPGKLRDTNGNTCGQVNIINARKSKL